MDKIENFIKNDKLKFITICIASFVFIVGLIMVIINVGDTYAESTSDYSCPLGNYSSDGSTSIPASFYDDNSGYFCRINKVGVSSANYTVGTSLIHDIGTPKNDSACYKYLTEMGYTYLERSDAGCYYKAINKNVGIIGKCYQCNSPDTLYEWSAGYPSTANCPSGWHERTDITSESNCKDNTPKKYTVSYDANGGSGAPSAQTADVGTIITISNTIPTRSGYQFKGWGENANTSTVIYNAGDSYTGSSIMLFAVWKKVDSGSDNDGGDSGNTDGEIKITYSINYKLNGGIAVGNPNSASKDEVITINHPTKNVTVYCNDNNTGATIGNNPTAEFEFVGWTSDDVDTNNAYYGETLWSDKSTFVTDTKFKNLSITNGATVILEANWKDTSVELPSVTKEGYTCNWNTKTDGKGDSYESGDEYNLSGNSSNSVNFYAICEMNSKTDEEIIDPDDIQTGDVLILVVWAIGLGTLGYSAYYFMKRKNNI